MVPLGLRERTIFLGPFVALKAGKPHRQADVERTTPQARLVA
jgi:hypothetical protein